MDKPDNNASEPGGLLTRMKALDWIILAFPITFIVLGIGILTGIFFASGSATVHESIRWPVGLALLLWGVIRIIMHFNRLKKLRQG
jgi:uncharacterized membrane protein HdeD (DUF308 family)